MNGPAHADFWRDSGFGLLRQSSSGKLLVTDDFFRAYLLRPELLPIDESCGQEKSLHARLLEDPQSVVGDTELARVADEDVRQNYQVFLEFRRQLLAAESIEAAYRGIFNGSEIRVPPLFIDQLVHVLLRHILSKCDDAMEARAAELFFREQAATVQAGSVFLADREALENHASGRNFGSIGRLMAEANTPLKSVELDVLEVANAHAYWGRDNRHDFVVRLNHGTQGATAFCRVIERWVGHMTGSEVKVRSIHAIEDAKWAWHVGLDAESTKLLNDLWNGAEVAQIRLARLICLFRLDFHDPGVMRKDVAGRPVYMALSMDGSDVVRMKPQNLLANLPLREMT